MSGASKQSLSWVVQPLLVICGIGMGSVVAREPIAPEACVVTGQVTDLAGAGLADATVEWGSDKLPFERRQRTTTDATGRYRLVLASRDGTFHLAASAAGYATRVADSTFGPGEYVRDFKLRKTRQLSGYVAGRVVDRQGQAIAGATVEAFTPVVGFNSSFSMQTGRDRFPGPDRVATTDTDGRFRISDLSGEEVHLSLRAKGYYINDENYPTRGGLKIVMTGRGNRVPGVFRGRLVDAQSGRSLAASEEVRLIMRHTTRPACAVDGNGRFRLPGAATAGQAKLIYIYAKGYAATEAKLTAVLPDSAGEIDIPLKRNPAVQGVVIDADSRDPVAGSRLLYGIAPRSRFSYMEWSSFSDYADGHHTLRFVQHTTTDADGRFWFAEPADGERGVVVGLADGYQRLVLWPQERVTDDSGELLIPLTAESVITGTIRYAGRPSANIRVRASAGGSMGWSGYATSTLTDANGRYRLGKLPPGDYRVGVSEHGCQKRVAVPELGEAVLDFGDDPGELSVRGTAPRGMRITLVPKFAWERQRISAAATADGRFQLDGLKPGRYAVTTVRPGSGYFNRDRTPHEVVIDKPNQEIDVSPAWAR